MPKSKNTKSADDRKPPVKNRLADVLVAVLCLAGTAGCLWLFRQDLYRTLSRLNVKPVGTVVLKRRIVQRRFENRLLWDHLQKTAVVYSGDFIRTGEHSGAAITLTGNDAVTELGENTIVQIGLVKGTGENRIELFGGNVSLSAGSGETVLAAGKNTLVLAAGAAVNAASGGDGFAFRVDEGAAVFTGSEGTAETFRAGEGSGPEELPGGDGPAGNADSAYGGIPEGPGPAVPGFTGVETASMGRPRLIVPADGETFPYSDLREISFRWAADDDIGLYILEMADNPAMENAAVKMRVSGKRIAVSRPEEGRWYWRVTPVYAGSAAATASFSVGEAAGQPAAETEPSSDPGAAGQPAAQNAEQTAVERAAGRSAGTQPAPQPVAAEQPLVTTRPVTTQPVDVQPAVVEQPAVPQAPLPPPGGGRPENGSVLGPAWLRTNRRIIFTWNPVPAAAGYVFSLYRETDDGRQHIDTVEVRTPNYTFTQFSLLERGGFVWTVQALRKANDGTVEPGETAENRFIVDIPELRRYELPETGSLYGN
jgi:hypothetical protein